MLMISAVREMISVCVPSLFLGPDCIGANSRMAGNIGSCAKLLYNQSLVIFGCHDTGCYPQNQNKEGS